MKLSNKQFLITAIFGLTLAMLPACFNCSKKNGGCCSNGSCEIKKDLNENISSIDNEEPSMVEMSEMPEQDEVSEISVNSDIEDK